MVAPASEGGVQRNRAIVRAANAKGARVDTAAVRVKPLPDTGCLAATSGAALLPGLRFLC
jgi:hypothetical protein